MKKNAYQDHKYFALFLLVLASVIWGSSFFMIKKALLVFDASQVAILRILFAWAVLLPFSALYIFKYKPKRWLQFFIVGLSGNLLPAFLFAIAQTRLDSGITGVLNALTPLFTLLIGVFLYRTKMKMNQLVGVFLGLAGSAGLSFIGNGGDLAAMNFYVLFVMAATICYGFNVNYIKQYLSDIPVIRLTSLALFFIGPPALLYLFTGDFLTRMQMAPGAFTALGYLAILGIVNTAFALVIFFKLLKLTTAVYASSVTYIIPIVAILIGMMDGENIYLAHLAGMGLIIVGVYMVNKKQG